MDELIGNLLRELRTQPPGPAGGDNPPGGKLVTLVFLHPIGLDGESWAFLSDDLLDGAIRYNLPGHGGRPQGKETSIRSFAADVLENTTGSLDLIGLSMGGAVAQEIALAEPGRVRSVVVACSSPGGHGAATQRARAEAVESVGIVGVLRPTLERWFTKNALDQPDNAGVAYATRTLLGDDPRAFAAAWRALADHDTRSRLSELTMPTTILHAADDVASGIEAKNDMVALIPGSRLSVIPGPHMVQLESPEIFEAAVREHLDWVEAH